MEPRQVLIVGAGFGGLNAVKGLGNASGVEVTVVDRSNHHLFQPLLYQVAMAGLSPAEIAAPIRTLLSSFRNVRVLQGVLKAVDPASNSVTTDFGSLKYDYLVLACGARHSYFGHDEWEENAPGLKTLEQATEIRRRILSAFEIAERISDKDEQRRQLTFVIVGGGPTGVELAGAIGEMSRFTLARDFRNIDAKLARIILIEAGPRILPMFSAEQASRATRDLETLGVQVWVSSKVTGIDADGVTVGGERIHAATVLWAAGVEASKIGRQVSSDLDRQGRVIVEPDLSLKQHPNIFVIGDMAHAAHETGKPLPGTAPVAMQQGRYVARTILRDLKGEKREPFHFVDKGQMATIGRSRAILEIGRLRLAGWIAWIVWLLIHIYYLTGFKNRLLVVAQWAWSYLTFSRGARLIVNREWRLGRQ
ncbi:MAG TPA: NAD(P)/FAD-dependent oxidoreductase [Terriglobia bacterium]|nr:NAD(P)/FAD-dependent oxidoreductase [Terriglobia bacterium]